MSGLPSIPQGLPAGLEKYLRKLGEQFEITQSDRGSPLMAKPTIQDLIDIGVLQADKTQALKANGKSFTLGTATSWLSSSIPKWFTSLLNPPAPTGLQVAMNTSNIVMAWVPWVSDYYSQTIVYRSSTNNLSTAEQIGSTTGNTYVDNLPPTGQAYYYWVRNEAKSKNLSDYNAVAGTTVGNVASAPSITASFDTTDLVLSWPTPTSSLTIQYYIVRHGATFTGGTAVGTSNTNTMRVTAAFGGTRQFWVAAVDVNNQLGLAGSVSVTVTTPGAPTVLQGTQSGSLVLTYQSAAGSLPVASYEVRYGTSWAAGTTVAIGNQTRFETAINWAGDRTFWIGAYDTAGNLGAVTQSVFSPSLPLAVTLMPEVVDNNVLLRWTTSSGTLPIAYYIVDRGGVTVGNVAGLFTVVFESAGGTYTYGVTAVDTAGNVGTRTSVSAVVSQPSDFILYSNANSGFGGTKTNCVVDGSGGLLANVDTSETWASHFTSRSWTTIDQQVAAGYPYYAIGKTTGNYVETVDYGATVPASKATMTVNPSFLNGVITYAPTIEFSLNGTTWTAPAATFSVYGTAFRYVRYTLGMSATHDGTGLATDSSALVLINPLNYKLDVKQKTYQFMVNAVSTDAGGTSVDITGIFVDVSSIVLTALGTTPLICVYDFVDAPNPTTLKVLAFTTAGVRASATVSGTIRGT